LHITGLEHEYIMVEMFIGINSINISINLQCTWQGGILM